MCSAKTPIHSIRIVREIRIFVIYINSNLLKPFHLAANPSTNGKTSVSFSSKFYVDDLFNESIHIDYQNAIK